MKKLITWIVVALCSAASTHAVSAEQEFISIGTGGVTGVYYPAGGAICRLVNKGRKDHGIRCSAESTDGSIYNINAIKDGDLQFGVTQSDWQYHAYEGSSKFKQAGKFEKLRAVFSIHAEPVTIIASDSSGIKNITDFKNKRINIGNAGSGQRSTWDVIEAALDWKREDLKLATELKSSESGQALCDDKIDAYFWLVGHPSALTFETLITCPVHLANAQSPEIAQLISDNSYYRTATIPAGMYNNDKDIKTFGVGATLVTSADVSDKVVYTLVKSVFDNFDQFKRLHPALGTLTEKQMISDSLSAPLHEGAIKYFKERDWQ